MVLAAVAGMLRGCAGRELEESTTQFLCIRLTALITALEVQLLRVIPAACCRSTLLRWERCCALEPIEGSTYRLVADSKAVLLTLRCLTAG